MRMTMTKKLLAIALMAGGSLFAQSRFSVSIGSGYAPGYYAQVQRGRYGYSYNNAYRYDNRTHERAEKQALRNHQEEERWYYGNSHAPRDHQRQERRDLKHEQRHERYGDYDAGYGPGYSSVYDGSRYGYGGRY